MWLATTLGFFSVVCAHKGTGGPNQPVDTSRMMIRARVRSHLEALIRRFPNELGHAEILETPDADYRFRLFCSKAVWGQCVSALVADVSYDNFKDACGQIHGHASPYLRALHTTWSTFRGMKDH